jgi:predicted nucleotide-binding protein (sugar kinase/HSP70/actin superfamily)
VRHSSRGVTSEVRSAVTAGYKALAAFNKQMQYKGREILRWCAENDRPCILVLALERSSTDIIAAKKLQTKAPCPLLGEAV